MNDSDAILRLLEGKSRVIPYIGKFAGLDATTALVDLGQNRLPVPFTGGYIPQVGETVHVWSIDGAMFMIGPTDPKPGTGVVATVSGDYVRITTDFGTFSMPYGPPSDPPTSGDFVGINWSWPPWCMKLSTSPDPVTPPPDPGGGSQPQTRSAEFRATDAGSTDRSSARWWTSNPYASNTTYGAWFYGQQIKDTIPAAAEFVSLEIYIAYQQRRGDAPRFALHDRAEKVGVPGFASPVTWAPSPGWQTPPDSEGWFAALKAGGDRYGVGLDQGGYNIFKSLAQDGMSGALRITWKA
jgi:hypothetical protein